MKKFLVRISIAAASVLLILTGILPVRAAGDDFDAFLEQEWKKMMEEDYLTMHYSVRDPEKMGIKKAAVSLGHKSYAAMEADRQSQQASLEQLHTYDYESLNERQKTDYITYESYLIDKTALNSYPDFQEMFNPYTGEYGTITSNFTEFVFHTKEDIEDYLILLDDYDRYLDEMMEMTRTQAANGYFMTDEALDVQLDQMKLFIDQGEKNPFIIIIFNSSMDAFEALTEEERTAYKEKNRELVLNQVIPGIEKQMNMLKTFRGSRKYDFICEYPGGKEYYTALARNKTGSSDSLQEMLDFLGKSLKDIMAYYVDATITYAGSQREETSVISDFSSPEEILDYLRSHMEGFPKGPDVNYTISYLDPSVANPNTLAYYIPPCIDDISDNVIRINGTSDAGKDKNTLYYTLAHEGMPGHMYQNTWYFSQEYNPIRHDLSVLGYTEGWAQYVERIMLSRSSLDKMSEENVSCNMLLGYVLQAGIDIAVNGLNYTSEQVSQWAQNHGLAESDFQYIIDKEKDIPGSILPYGYGMMKFWEYREKTRSALGETFDPEEFHLQLLTGGPRPFEVVENDVRTYIESKGKKYPVKFTFLESERTPEMKRTGSILMYVSKHPIQVLILLGIIVLIGIVLIVLLVVFLIKLIFGRKKKRSISADQGEQQ